MINPFELSNSKRQSARQPDFNRRPKTEGPTRPKKKRPALKKLYGLVSGYEHRHRYRYCTGTV
jgi:hypothetical protein